MTEEQAAKLVAALQGRFGGEAEAHPDDEDKGRFDFSVISPYFTGMTTLHRQDAAWEVVNQTVGREDVLDVGMIWALAPGEIDEFVNSLGKGK
jgi:stress-induced morphogen